LEQILQKHTRSILAEIDSLLIHRDRENLVESRANNVIISAVNLINYIRENYDADTAQQLENRLLNSIRSQDVGKFTRGVRKLRNNHEDQ
jgi:ABC-type protease/lipase transport system fused ATPase/permease subunit